MFSVFSWFSSLKLGIFTTTIVWTKGSLEINCILLQGFFMEKRNPIVPNDLTLLRPHHTQCNLRYDSKSQVTWRPVPSWYLNLKYRYSTDRFNSGALLFSTGAYYGTLWNIVQHQAEHLEYSLSSDSHVHVNLLFIATASRESSISFHFIYKHSCAISYKYVIYWFEHTVLEVQCLSFMEITKFSLDFTLCGY